MMLVVTDSNVVWAKGRKLLYSPVGRPTPALEDEGPLMKEKVA
jgi:hypothetical protein